MTNKPGATPDPVSALGVSCPFCDADVAVTESRPGLNVVEVCHDNSCPDYQARRARGAAS